MRPLLECLRDGKEHSVRETLNLLSKHFRLTDAEKGQLLPSGRQEIFTNRVAWAKTHLRMAGLVEGTGRGLFKITNRGEEVLRESLGRIDLRVLQKQPGYLEARGRSKEKTTSKTGTDEQATEQTPAESIENAYTILRENLGRDLLIRIKESSPSFFERLVVELLVRMGYGGSRKDAGRAIGKSSDEGIDGIIKEDRLGLDTIYIQAKKWEGTISRPEIQKFAGALQGVRAKKGIFITTSEFRKEAEDYAAKIESKIVLIDGEQLWNYMIDFNIGVASQATYEIKRMDNDYFDEDSA
ncbi:MAG: Restriction endonuclease [Verrucomicrobiales bacterium]|nr:Restriction endonuclease [Verrucomicrobiales bacterium]